MTKKVDKDWAKFFNPKEIKKNLIDASLFLSFFEILKNEIIERIFHFYSNEYNDGKWIPSEEYKKDIIGRKIYGNNKRDTNIFLSSCQWLVDTNAISQDEYDQIEKIIEHRNRIAHDLPKFLFDSDYIIDKGLFNQIKELTLKIEKWWILEFEMPISGEFDGQNIDPDGIIPGQQIILDYIFNIATTDIDELEREFKKIEENIQKEN